MHVLHGSKSKKIKIKMHTTQNALAYDQFLHGNISHQCIFSSFFVYDFYVFVTLHLKEVDLGEHRSCASSV